MTPEFVAYSKRVMANAKTLARELSAAGFRVVSGGTDTHLMLVDVFAKGVRGKEAEVALDRAYITANKNAIPFDVESAAESERDAVREPRGDYAWIWRSGDAGSGGADHPRAGKRGG